MTSWYRPPTPPSQTDLGWLDLRDYFAARALGALELSRFHFSDGSGHDPELIARTAEADAKTAYIYADAMLAEKAKSKP